MNNKQDIRWHQRFSNYRKALQKLNTAVDIVEKKLSEEEDENIDEILKEGLIQRFEYTYELAWNVMKDYAEYQGSNTIAGSRDATREAFKMGLITEADEWMNMLKSRTLTTHTYNKDTADEIHLKIVKSYHKLFLDFESRMEELRSGEQMDIFNPDK